MFVKFFAELKSAKVPVTLKEYLTLMEALEADLADKKVEDFYYLSRTALVKDERHLDKFDLEHSKMIGDKQINLQIAELLTKGANVYIPQTSNSRPTSVRFSKKTRELKAK